MLNVRNLLLLPVSVVRVVLVGSLAAREHPQSQQLRRLLHDGWDVTRFDVDAAALRVSVDLERGGEGKELRSSEPAFAFYCLRAIPRARARLMQEQMRELTALP